MSASNLKKIDFSSAELERSFANISNAVDESEANFRKAGSNRVEEDLRIMRTVFRARSIVEDILEQLRPWANAFGFNPQDLEEVKLSWSLTVGKAVGICHGLLTELAPGWQSRGRIGTNAPNTIEGLVDALNEINSANLDATPETRTTRTRPAPTPASSSATSIPGELPMPKGMSESRLRAAPKDKEKKPSPK